MYKLLIIFIALSGENPSLPLSIDLATLGAKVPSAADCPTAARSMARLFLDRGWHLVGTFCFKE